VNIARVHADDELAILLADRRVPRGYYGRNREYSEGSTNRLMLASRNHGIPWRNRLSTRDEMMTLIEIQRASSSWKLRQLYVQGPVLTVHNETPWHDQPDGDFSSAIRLGIGLRHSWAWDEPTFCLRVPQLPPLVLAVSAKRSCSHGGAWVPWKFFH
jgi:hypothetical protein